MRSGGARRSARDVWLSAARRSEAWTLPLWPRHVAERSSNRASRARAATLYAKTPSRWSGTAVHALQGDDDARGAAASYGARRARVLSADLVSRAPALGAAGSARARGARRRRREAARARQRRDNRSRSRQRRRACCRRSERRTTRRPAAAIGCAPHRISGTRASSAAGAAAEIGLVPINCKTGRRRAAPTSTNARRRGFGPKSPSAAAASAAAAAAASARHDDVLVSARWSAR